MFLPGRSKSSRDAVGQLGVCADLHGKRLCGVVLCWYCQSGSETWFGTRISILCVAEKRRFQMLWVGHFMHFTRMSACTYLFNFICRKRMHDYEQVVVTPSCPNVPLAAAQLNEENEDFASRRRYHQSAVVQGHYVDDV